MTGPDEVAPEVRTTAAADGVILEYEVVGDGRPVACLHGGFADRGSFSKQRSVLSKDFRVLLISSRGHDGADGTLPPDFGFATSEVEDVCRVLDAENIDRTCLVGHSTRVATAFGLARSYPDRVEKMALVEPTLFRLLPSPEHEQVTEAMLGVVAAGDQSGSTAAMRAMVDFLRGERWDGLDEVKKTVTMDSLTAVSPLVLPHVRSLLGFPIASGDVKALIAPTLLFYGTVERTVSFSTRRYRRSSVPYGPISSKSMPGNPGTTCTETERN